MFMYWFEILLFATFASKQIISEENSVVTKISRYRFLLTYFYVFKTWCTFINIAGVQYMLVFDSTSYSYCFSSSSPFNGFSSASTCKSASVFSDVHVTVVMSGLIFESSPSFASPSGVSFEDPLAVPFAPPFLTMVGCFLRSSSSYLFEGLTW